uniref:Aspergillus nuclease S1 n=1 Tax=Anthurium amnicola TaxID=1678845 RepID=A0A1D1XUF8_9ARAE
MKKKVPFGFQAQMPCLLLLAFLLPSVARGWGTDGHLIVCRIAQGRLREESREVVEELLPDYARNDLSSLCSWADHVKFLYPWSSPLHYVDTPDHLCSYNYDRDCKDVETGEKDVCVSGAIRNYTDQLFRHSGDNQTQALLFLSHFMGDIHQPLHVGFTSDKGGNTIHVHWYTQRQVLHHVWDSSIIDSAIQRFYNNSVEGLIDDLNRNITGIWADQVPRWESCSLNDGACPDTDATESINAACDWAYKNVTNGTALGDEYFHASLPIVYQRLAQGGVRLAATLNHVLWDGDED